MGDIFGNLDNFLETYDDNCLDGSIDEEALNDSISAPSPVAKRNSKRKSQLPEAPAAEVPTSIEVNPAVPCPSTIQQPNVVEVIPAVAEPTIPAPAATIDLSGCPHSDLDDEMRELTRKHDYIFLSTNPVVTQKLLMEARAVSVITRSYSSLKSAYQTKKPVTATEINKFRQRLNKLKPKLNRLHNDIETLLMDVNPDTTAATQRPRSQRRLDPVCPPDVITITLDPDDPPGLMPMPAVFTDTINLDSDTEEPPLTAAQLSTSFEAENYRMRIKVKWGTSIEIFEHRRHQKFVDIMAQLAARDKADTDRILLNIGDRIIYADDTPDTINYKSFQFISGRILQKKPGGGGVAKNGPPGGANSSKAGLITLKLQLEKRKKPLQIRIEKTQSMAVVIVKCAEELKCKPEKIRLYFDGEAVDSRSKPDDLELEGDEVLDVRLVD
ncbi:uncharacterized protein LOC126575420 [Anopheles aquasalis]|uniref:uncharacterized protein LOC126575420 n=1 Tax=Anopheles aquasalis TaxID=42839 RepID=UPI00215B19A8|nr:uncharacterized protein LOC126575420 [Anopheles aquasalis]